MPLLNAEVRADVKAALADLDQPVVLKVFSQSFECQYCKETRELMQEVADLSDRLSVEVYDFEKDRALAESLGIDKAPAAAVIGARDYGIRIFGIPSGYEFASLIESIRMVSAGESGLAPETREMVAGLSKPTTIQVFITPTCPYCQQAVLLAYRLAMESDLISAHMVEVIEFPHLAVKYEVMGVPRTVIDETIHIEGAVPESRLMEEFARLVRGSD